MKHPDPKTARIKAVVDSYERVELRCRAMEMAIRSACATPEALLSFAVQLEVWLRTGQTATTFCVSVPSPEWRAANGVPPTPASKPDVGKRGK
jgi:hypothetical protein